MKINHPRESGQILIVLAVALIGMLGLTALAVDGGMIYADRRFSQSASDTASLVGAGAAAQYMEANGVLWTNFTCSKSEVVAAFSAAFNSAKNAAANNQFQDLDNVLSDKHGIEITCVDDPDHFEKYLDVHTMITSNVSTSFIHLFYKGPVKNTVNSVVRIHPRTEQGFGHAIVGLNDTCGSSDGGVLFDGSNGVLINGGGVFSNSCIKGAGTVDVNVTNGGIEYVGELDMSGNPILQPDPEKKPVEMPNLAVQVPNCGSEPPVASQGGGDIYPGNYSRIKLSNGALTLHPGLYCVSGEFAAEGGTVNGDGVTIYMLKDGTHDTSLTINGNVEVHLNTARDNPAEGGAITGVLIYMADGNQGDISLEGTSVSSFAGEIYAPDGTIDIGGTSGVNPTYNTQLIGKYVKIHGTADIDINYTGYVPYTTTPKLDMME